MASLPGALENHLLSEGLLLLGVPLLILLVATAVFRFSNVDVAICGWFFGGAEVGWPYHESQPWITLYHYGPLPGLVLGIAGAVVGLLGTFWSRLRAWREMGLFLAAVLALGPGLAVNCVFKPLWTRPRPQQVEEFGGPQAFVGVWSIGPQGSSKSFPSGHASMGFFFMTPAFLLYRQQRRWAIGFLVLGLVAGGVLGLARIAQGQHFPSDILWSGGMVYLSGLVLSYVFRLVDGATAYEGADEPRPVIFNLEGQGPDEARPAESETVAPRRRAA